MTYGRPTTGAGLQVHGPRNGAYRPTSPALRWEVRRRGDRRYLSSGQSALLLVARHLVARGRGVVTLDELARLSGSYYTRGDDGLEVPNRGRTSDRLARLRSLGLVGYQGARGRTGRIRLWIPSGGRPGVSTRAYRSRTIGGVNDSASPPGGYLSRERGVETAWRRARGGGPPGSPGRSGLTGPRRGRRPPRILYAKCPAGHRARIGLAAWKATRSALRAEWSGRCNRCRRMIRESVDLTLIIPGRPPSTGELEDPALLERRRSSAVDLIAGGGLGLELVEQLTRDYLTGSYTPPGRPPGDSAGSPGPAAPLDSIAGILAALEGAGIPARWRSTDGEEHRIGAGDEARHDRAEGSPVTLGGDQGEDRRGEQGTRGG